MPIANPLYSPLLKDSSSSHVAMLHFHCCVVFHCENTLQCIHSSAGHLSGFQDFGVLLDYTAMNIVHIF